MCDPVTATLAAATALTATGSVIQGIQAKQQGHYAAAVANQNADLVRQQQQDAVAQQTRDRVQLDRKYGRLEGSQRAAIAANGIDATFGSASQVSADTAMLRNEDASNLYANENNDLRAFDIKAANFSSDAEAAEIKGNAAFTGALFSAGSTILSGASQYSLLKSKMGGGAAKSAYGISGSDGIY